MRPWKTGTILLMVGACSVAPTGPGRSSAGADPPSLSIELDPASLSLIAPGQLVTLELPEGETGRAWVMAHLTTGPDGVPIGDGAILVVSAADGPMPQSDPAAVTTSIRVEWAGVDADGTLRFEGIGTTTAGGKSSDPFPVSGTARPLPAPAPPPPPPQPPPQYIVWDIVGGNVHEAMRFTALGLLLVRAR